MVVELNPTAIALLRADLDEARFSEASLDGLWGPDAAAALRRNERVPALRALAALRARLGAPTAVASLAELFVLGMPVGRAALQAALPRLGVDGALALGLVGPAGERPASAAQNEAAQN